MPSSEPQDDNQPLINAVRSRLNHDENESITDERIELMLSMTKCDVDETYRMAKGYTEQALHLKQEPEEKE